MACVFLKLKLPSFDDCQAIAKAAQTTMSEREKPTCDWSNFDGLPYNLGVNIQSSTTKIGLDGKWSEGQLNTMEEVINSQRSDLGRNGNADYSEQHDHGGHSKSFRNELYQSKQRHNGLLH